MIARMHYISCVYVSVFLQTITMLKLQKILLIILLVIYNLNYLFLNKVSFFIKILKIL